MPGPTLYIKNALRLAELGLGDGTVYASATSATPNVSQKTFALAGLSIIADLGADADDKFNGHLLYFPASKNSYHIVDWVAATDTLTVYENPAATDTGACEIRRALVCKLQLAGNPAKFLADGQRYALWKSAANTTIEVHLPNLIENGGFESGALSPWNASFAGTGVIAVNAVTPILGARDVRMNRGDQPSVILEQVTREGFKKNRKYQLLFKARSAGAFSSGDLHIYFYSILGDAVLSNPSSGTITAAEAPYTWLPILGGQNAWHSIDITAPAWDNHKGGLRFTCNTAVDIFLDEVYLFEQVNVAALLLFDGVANNAETNPSPSCTGRRVTKDRTGQTAGVDNAILLPAQAISGGEARLLEFAPAIYPIYTIESSDLVQASEILLAEKWVWGRSIFLPFDPLLIEKEEVVVQSRSGVRRAYKHSQARRIKGTVRYISDADLALWKDSWYPHHHETRHPFAVKLDSTSRPLLVEDTAATFGTPYDTKRPTMNFDWIEVVK